jgi:hypothetical protein
MMFEIESPGFRKETRSRPRPLCEDTSDVELDAVGQSWFQGWIGMEVHLKRSSIGDCSHAKTGMPIEMKNDFNLDYVSAAKLGQPSIL